MPVKQHKPKKDNRSMARFLLSILTGYIFSLLFPGGIPMPPVKQIATGRNTLLLG